MNQKLITGVKRMLLSGVGVWIASQTSSGITYQNFWVLAGVAAALSLFSMVLKPLFVVMTLPFVVLTLGLGLWVINALLLMLAAQVIPGFSVASFGSALWGAFLISFISFAVPYLFRRRERPSITIQTEVASVEGSIAQRYSKQREESVIDV